MISDISDLHASRPCSWTWNGTAFTPCAEAPISDRGFRYGMALFESLAVRGGCVEFLAGHLARLEASCRRCGWPVEPAALAQAGECLKELAKRSSSPVFARIYVTAGDGAPADPVAEPRIFLFAESRELPAARTLCIRLHPEPFLPAIGGIKTANYWANAEALRQAHEAGCAEALLFNPNGELISACMANVFVELGGEWITPPVACGARPGVTREWAMHHCEVAERSIFPEALKEATGCFLTSCWSGVVPVASLEGRPIPTEFAEKLRDEFFRAWK